MLELDPTRLPRHVAVIMDGNGRWAEQRGLPRLYGHRVGKDSVRAVVETSRRLGVKYLSLYAFSTENWARPLREVDGLMALLRRYLASELGKMMKHQIRLRAVGSLRRLPPNVREALRATVEATKRWPEIVSVAYHPGVVRTRFGHESAIYGFFYRWAPGLRSPERGARTLVWLATVDRAELTPGGYYVDEKLGRPAPKATDPAAAAALWDTSLTAVGAPATG